MNETEIDFSPFVPQVQYELIPIKNLVSNQDYQRALYEKNIQKAAKDFDLYQINPVKVSRRDGINYVFNGQHTIEIVALVSGSRETPVWCMIYDDLVYQREADIFANQMKYTKNLTPYEVFTANIEAGNDAQLLIRDTVESYGLCIANKSKPGKICAVATLERIYKNYGFHVLDRTLRLIIGTWEGAPHSFSSNMLSGVARLIYCFGDALKDELFKEKLGLFSVKELTRTARDRRSGSMGFSEAMLIAYNKKNQKNALQISKLYNAPANRIYY
ncbi:MAG: hypothetical protein Q4D32_01725 [Eubacteriales bacterium]|nr:hypothetical protein [Eubacteriales bacterium]